MSDKNKYKKYFKMVKNAYDAGKNTVIIVIKEKNNTSLTFNELQNYKNFNELIPIIKQKILFTIRNENNKNKENNENKSNKKNNANINIYAKYIQMVKDAYDAGENTVKIVIENYNIPLIFNDLQNYETFNDLGPFVQKKLFVTITNTSTVTSNGVTYYVSNPKSFIAIQNLILTDNFYNYGINNELSVKINDDSTQLLKY